MDALKITFFSMECNADISAGSNVLYGYFIRIVDSDVRNHFQVNKNG